MDSNLNKDSRGMALIAALMLLGVVLSLFGVYVALSQNELALVRRSRDSHNGFNAAEAGLNLRAEEIRNIFVDYAKPDGTSPGSLAACDAGTMGTGDYVCKEYEFENKHHAMTFVVENPDNPLQRVIPPGESFAGLSAQEYRYTVTSVGRNQTE
ncbi:MAG: hypothetical protein KDD53_04585, partial [Bdellovibrionales bacterium]|nr:hypothetical protein [Bdellovibrionales bacterium]